MPGMLSIFDDATGRCIGFLLSQGPRGWLPVDSTGGAVGGIVATAAEAAERLRAPTFGDIE